MASGMLAGMLEWLSRVLGALSVALRSQRDLAVENVLLRQQLAVALRSMRRHPRVGAEILAVAHAARS